MRRISLFLWPLVALLVSISTSAAVAQSPSLSGFQIGVDQDIQAVLTEAREAVERKQYHSAVQMLQLVLDRPEDSFRERDFENDHGMLGGTRKEAQQILTSLPPEGQATYELEYGAEARRLLDDALQSDRREGLVEVLRRFSITAAGFDATVRLAASAADQDQPLQAALLLEPLRYHPKRTPQVSLQRALYWARAGRVARGVAALRDARKALGGKSLRVGGRDVTIPADEETAAKWLLSLDGIERPATPLSAWTMAGGAPTRNSAVVPASPAGGSIWRVSTLEHLVMDGPVEDEARQRSRLQQALNATIQSVQEEGQPNIPAAQPLVIGDTVVYRTVGDVTAVSLKTGKLLWRSSLLDESLVKLLNPRTIEAQIRASRIAVPQSNSLENHLERRVYRDLAAGTLSSDGRTVFALEDLDAAGTLSVNAFGIAEPRPVNRLVAYDLAGGQILWEVGGQRGSPPADLSAQFFLGPPLPLDDCLYVLSESQGALQLLVLKQNADRQAVEIAWSQSLLGLEQSLATHPPRRLSGLAPASSDGVLVCPTSSGAVIAIDKDRRSLIWGFQYPSLIRTDPIALGIQAIPRAAQYEFAADETDKSSRWMDNNPLIAEGKVLITPRDSETLYCLDLVDGHEIWQMPRDEWLYVACAFQGKAILVGRNGLGAVTLSDGTPLDSFADTEVEPTGRGIRVEASYFLPTARGEVATIDLQTGHVLARSKLAGGVIPGNLAAANGAIVSLSATDVLGFAHLSELQALVASQLRADARDPRALALRGELRLHGGHQAEGLADLRESLKIQTEPRVKLVLASALLAAVRADPSRLGELVPELEAITDDPQQRNDFLRMYSQALEAAGDRRGAFRQLIRLAQTSEFLDDLKQLESTYSVRTDRSIRARLIHMSSTATPEERKELNQIVREQLRLAAADTDHPETLERTLQFLRGLPEVDAELLAIALDLSGEPRQQLLRTLQQSTDPSVAGRVLAMRCVEQVESESWSRAASLIKILRRDFPDQVCLDGKTGRGLAEEWSAQPKLATLLIAPRVWPEGPIEPQRIPRDRPAPPITLPVEILSRQGGTLEGWSFETDALGSHVIARDEFGLQQWKLALQIDLDHNDPETRSISIPFQAQYLDHWLVLSRLTYFYVIDVQSPTGPRIAWHQSLKPVTEDASEVETRIRFNGRFGRAGVPRTGQVLGLTQETVVYAIGAKIYGAEISEGRLVWSRHETFNGPFDGSVDEHVVAMNSGGYTTLVRTLDGARISRRQQRPGMVLWTRGRQRLVRQVKPTHLEFELVDIERDVTIWTQESPRDSLWSVIEDQDLALLEPSGMLRVLRLVDQQQRYQVELPIKPEPDKSWFTVQRSRDCDVVLGGETYRHRGAQQMIPFESGSQNPVPFDGHVCGVSPVDGKLLWSTAVEKAALEPTQAGNLPVLLLATRQVDGRAAPNNFYQRFRMMAYIIDKRTGRQIYTSDETAPAMAPRLDARGDGRIIANFYDWVVELTFPAIDKKPDAVPRQESAR